MSNIVSIGLAQINAEPLAVEENRARSVRSATEAFQQGADIVVLPEMIIPTAT